MSACSTGEALSGFARRIVATLIFLSVGPSYAAESETCRERLRAHHVSFVVTNAEVVLVTANTSNRCNLVYQAPTMVGWTPTPHGFLVRVKSADGTFWSSKDPKVPQAWWSQHYGPVRQPRQRIATLRLGEKHTYRMPMRGLLHDLSTDLRVAKRPNLPWGTEVYVAFAITFGIPYLGGERAYGMTFAESKFYKIRLPDRKPLSPPN